MLVKPLHLRVLIRGRSHPTLLELLVGIDHLGRTMHWLLHQEVLVGQDVIHRSAKADQPSQTNDDREFLKIVGRANQQSNSIYLELSDERLRLGAR